MAFDIAGRYRYPRTLPTHNHGGDIPTGRLALLYWLE
jgi:hypothetical protein